MFKINNVFTQYKGLSKSIYIIFFARMVTSMGAFIWPMLTFIMSGKMNFSDTTIGLVSAGTGLLFLPASIIGGKLADKFNKKKIIIIFDTISIVFFISCAFLEPGIPMLIGFTIAGLFANMEWPAFDALFIEASKPEEREKVYSLTYLGMNLGLVFGAALGGFLYKDHLSLAFILDGLTTFSSTILIVLFVKIIKHDDLEPEEVNEYENEEESHISTRKVLWDRKPVLIMMGVFIIAAFIYEQWSFSLPLYLSQIFGDKNGAQMYGVLVSFNGFIVIAFTPILTSLLSKLKELPKVIMGIGLYSISFLIIRNEPLKMVFFIMIFFFTIGEIVNTIGSNPYISRRIPASHRGRVSSYMGIGYMIGGTAGRLISGILNDTVGYDFTFSIVGILGIICMIIVSMNYKLDKKVYPKLYIKTTKNMNDEYEKEVI
ncbi:MAG: MFS transporter [Clostridia bacterium]|nr:MFS transporter [Clostridia bacterium]